MRRSAACSDPIPRSTSRWSTRSIRTSISRSFSSGSSAIKSIGLVALAGVQSNQYPRALDIARPFRAAGVPVLIGGFHVSGVLAMLPELTPELKATVDMGISMFAGESEGRMDLVLPDAANGTKRRLQLPQRPAGPAGQPMPFLPPEHGAVAWGTAPFDAGRGCPYQCSFCTIINVQGGHRGLPRRRRRRDNWCGPAAQGIKRLFITDDDLARNRKGNWEAIFDRLILLHKKGQPEDAVHHPGRYPVPQDSPVHRKGRACRHQPRPDRP